MEATTPQEKQQHIDRMKKIYFDPQSKRSILPLKDEHNVLFESYHGRLDAAFLQILYRDYRLELEEEFIRYCEDRMSQFGLDTIDEYLSKSAEELTILFDELDGGEDDDDDDDFGDLLDSDLEAMTANNDGTGKATKKHYAELFQLIADVAMGRFNERFYYFYSYLTHWADETKSPYLDQDFLFCIDVSRLREIANDLLLQAKIRYILETYLESSQTSNSLTCRIDITSPDVQMKMMRALQKALAINSTDFTSLEEARTTLVKEKLVHFYAGFKAYLYRMNLSKTHPSRLARLQEKLINVDRTRQDAQPPMKVNPRSSASSKRDQTPPSTPIDITSVTKTQRLLNERMKTFDKIQSTVVNDVPFPNVNRSNRQRTSANSKLRSSIVSDGPANPTERLNSAKEKARGPIHIQYSLTNGLKVKCVDGRPTTGGSANANNGGRLQQPRASVAYSMTGVPE